MTDDDIPLDITGHEDREPPGSTSGDDDGGMLTGSHRSESADSLGEECEEAPESDIDASEFDVASGTNEDAGENVTVEETAEQLDEESDGSETVEPVEVLVGLAKDGEIEPWDIDIVAVTDKYLDRIDEADLRTSGRALFYASVLLRMKGDAMLSEDEPEDEAQIEPWEQAMEGEEPLAEPDPFASLKREMDRRLERKRARGMPQTLDELVRDLRAAERDNWWKRSREYDTSASPETYQRGTQELDYHSNDSHRFEGEPTAGDVTQTTHGEDIDTIIDDVHRTIREHYEQGRKEVLFREIDSAGGSRVYTYLGLLFLSHRGQVRLRQDELFGDLWIQDPSAVVTSDEALAD